MKTSPLLLDKFTEQKLLPYFLVNKNSSKTASDLIEFSPLPLTIGTLLIFTSNSLTPFSASSIFSIIAPSNLSSFID